MENREQQRIRSVANIVNQQPINPVEPNKQNSGSTLDQRIKKMQNTAALARILGQARNPTQPLFQLDRSALQKSTSQQSTNSQASLPPQSMESTPIPSTSQPNPVITLPTLQIPKKSNLTFMEKFKAQHDNHENPEYYKVATIACAQDKNKIIPIYRFADEKRAYEAAEGHGRNQYKFNGRLVSYFPEAGKVPNKAKFKNEYQKQVWIHMLENIGTYNLYTLLGNFDDEENVIIHNLNQPINVYFNGLRDSILMATRKSLQAFELKERNRNIIIETREKKTLIVIESVISYSNHKRTPEDIERCPIIDKAIREQQEYAFKSQSISRIRNDIVFISTQGCYDETTMQEHLVEITIMDYHGRPILSTIITPRVFVTINPKHLGFDEDDLTSGKDEINMMEEIRKMVKNKVIIGYDIKKTLRLGSIFTYYFQGYIDLEKSQLLKRKSGINSTKVKLTQLTKSFHIKTKYPIRTMQRCSIYRQLWKKIELEALDILQITEQYQEQDVLELQNQMEDEFTSIGHTPANIPRTLIKETSKANSAKVQPKFPTTTLSIDTSPMKKLKLTTNEDMANIPILTTITRKCRTQKSNITKICLINGEEYQIQAIIANPLHEPNRTIICQTSKPNDSQGREVLKGGRYVEDHREQNMKNENSN